MNRRSLITGGSVGVTAALVVGLAIFAPLSMGHHSSYFDPETTLSITGMVTELAWMNPHAFLLVDVVAEDGHIDRWTIEGRSPNQLRRSGWSQGTIRPGDMVTVRGRPPRELSTLADGIGARFFLGAGPITLPDGSTRMFGGQVAEP